MPLVKRTVLPTALCRNKLPNGLKNELECVTNNTLSGVINQLASLSQHAEDIFGELFSEANTFYGRASSLKDRIESLSVKVTQLDSNIEEVQLLDINSRKAFKSSVLTDQQVVSRQSLPNSVMDTYNQADAPPPLQDLNQFRDDGKDGLKIYTDPDYFFNLWREAIQKETREAKEKRREQRRRDRKSNYNLRRDDKVVRQAVNTRKQQAQRLQHGAEFVDTAATKTTSQRSVRRTSTKKQPQPMPQKDYVPTPAETNIADLPPPSEMPPPSDDSFPYTGIPPPDVTRSPELSSYDPPPPPLEPPPPPQDIGYIPPPVPMTNAPPPPPAPAPPPPPPPVSMAPSSGGGGLSGLGAQLQNVSLKKAEPQPVVVDERSNLLQAIRIGINLKKVEEKERSQAPTSASNDVASILARRIAVEFSDSDVSDSTYASDDDWDD